MPRRVLYFAILCLLLLIVPIRLSNSLRAVAVRAVGPAGRPLSDLNCSITNSFIGLTQIPSLLQQRYDLQRQVVALQYQLLEQEQLAKENAALRQELGVTGAVQQSAKVLTHVVIAGSDPADRTLVVDVGTNQNVTEGQPAIYEGALIGRVIKVSRDSAVIRLITSTRSLIQSRIASNQQKGILTTSANGLQLSDIRQGSLPASNSSVETSGLGGNLPAGILIGTLGEILSKPSNPTQSFKVSLPNDPGTLTTFFILLTASGK